MDRHETLCLWNKCESARLSAKRDAKSDYQAHLEATAVWNDWALKMVSQRGTLKANGTWKVTEDKDGHLQAGNKETCSWMEEAKADFSNHKFVEDMDCRHWTFPGNAVFDDATFAGQALFTGADFRLGASFRRVTFCLDAVLEFTTFAKLAEFDKATFEQSARFEGTKFLRKARFPCVKFEQNAYFEGVTFRGNARFRDARFKHDGWFDHATFGGYTTFRNAKFGRRAKFHGALFELSLSLGDTTFSWVPDFIQAHFTEAPRFETMEILPKCEFDDSQESLAARYRALKRLAIQGHDYGREQKYFADELKALRGVEDKLVPGFWRTPNKGRRLSWPGGTRYWFGLMINFLRTSVGP